MQTALATRPTDDAIEQVLITGDLLKLTAPQRVSYYNAVCQSLELNPLTKPFAYISLNGKLVLYALKDCTEQLRSRRAVSVTIAAREIAEDCYVVTARASLPTGRQDESIGAVSIAGLKGEARANAMMKAETKAKRRVTLSICGLGMLDETEIESIPGAQPGYVIDAPALPEKREKPSVPNGGELGPFESSKGVMPSESATAGPLPVSGVVTHPPTNTSDDGPDLGVDVALPEGADLIVRCEKRASAVEVTTAAGKSHLVFKQPLQALAEQVCQNREPVMLELKRSASGNYYINGITKLASINATKWTGGNCPTCLSDPCQCGKAF